MALPVSDSTLRSESRSVPPNFAVIWSFLG